MLNFSEVLITFSGIFVFLSIAIIIATIVKEKDFFIKLVCMEVLSNVFVIAIAVFSLVKQMYFLLNVAIVAALLIFLGTIAFCSLLAVKEAPDA